MVGSPRRHALVVVLAGAGGAGLGLLTQALALVSAFLVAADSYGLSGPRAFVKFGAPLVAGTFSCASYGCLNSHANQLDWEFPGLTINVLSLAAAGGLLGLTGRLRFPASGIATGGLVAAVLLLTTGLGPSGGQPPIPANESMLIWATALMGGVAGAGTVWALEKGANRRRARRANQ
jgi:hypothetical protein